MRRKTGFRAACALTGVVLGGASPAVHCHPTLSFAVTSHEVPQPGQAGAATDQAYPLVVVLGHQYLSIDMKGKRTVYDFAKYRLLVLDLEAKTYEDYSLYSDIGFRVLEFQNRLMLGNMLATAKVPAPVMDGAPLENLFSLVNDKAPTEVTRRHGTHETVFESNAHELMRVSDATRELPADYRSEYWRFVRYAAGGHPKALAMLAGTPGVPERLTMVLTNQKVETRTLTLQSLANPPDAPYSLAGFELRMPDREPYRTLRTVGEDAPAQLALRVTAALGRRDAALAAGHPLEALLANDEAMLSTGDGHREWLTGARERLLGDEATHRLIGALGAHDEAAARQAAADLHALRESAGDYLDVIDIFEGNTLLTLKQGAEGQALLLAAVGINPYLTGAWHDLGDFYYRSFRMPEAWACLDAARRIAPEDPMLEPMNRLEQSLRERNPGFF